VPSSAFKSQREIHSPSPKEDKKVALEIISAGIKAEILARWRDGEPLWDVGMDTFERWEEEKNETDKQVVKKRQW
jgi:hypothetical protein